MHLFITGLALWSNLCFSPTMVLYSLCPQRLLQREFYLH